MDAARDSLISNGWHFPIKRRAKKGTEGFPPWKRCFHFNPNWLWQEIHRCSPTGSSLVSHLKLMRSLVLLLTSSKKQKTKKRLFDYDTQKLWLITFTKCTFSFANIFSAHFPTWTQKIHQANFGNVPCQVHTAIFSVCHMSSVCILF